MKKTLFIFGAVALLSCNVNVDEENEHDSTGNRLDTFIQQADTTLERWGDSAKEKYKDIRDDVKDRLDDDSADNKQQ